MTEWPEAVRDLAVTLRKAGVWHIITENRTEVGSCKDAAHHRNRLGHTGIPLRDEMKTAFGHVSDGGSAVPVLVHCRGDQSLDLGKLNSVLGGRSFERLPKAQAEGGFDVEYGRVNPFLGFRRPGIMQIFDQSLLRADCLPGTCMTNADHLRFGVEFCVAELIDALDKATVADVAMEGGKSRGRPETLGILTGNSPESGMLLWQRINETIRSRLGPSDFRGDISLPSVVLESLPGMGLSMELAQRTSAVRGIVLGGVEALCRHGASLICVACNTSHFFSPEIEEVCSRNGAEFLSMVTAVERYLQDEGVKKFDLLGIDWVTDFDRWSAFGALRQRFTVYVPPQNVVMKIIEVAFEVKKAVVSGSGMNKLRDVINQGTRTETVLLALTELSILLASQKRQRSGKRFLDTLTILAEAMAERYLAGDRCEGWNA